MSRAALLAVALAAVTSAARAQEFQPPSGGGSTSTGESGVRFGVLGFSTRGGGQVDHGGQGVLGATVDVAQLGSPQVRLRPSFEMGFGRTAGKSLHVALEVVYRFQPDNAPSVPYIGAGLGYYDDGTTTRVWPNLVMGFELPFRPTFNWLLEYHSLDRLGRHRFLVGFAAKGAL